MHFRRSFHLHLLACAALVASGLSPCYSQAKTESRTVLAALPAYQAALRASRDGLHEVAALKFEHVLKEKELTLKESALVSERLVDALIRARLPEKALVALTLFEVPEVRFWRGQALLLQHKFRDAEIEFVAYLNAAGTHATHARLALGQVIVGQGRENTGRKEFKSLLQHPDPAIAERARILSNESEVISGRAATVLKRLGTKRGNPESEFVKACAYLKTGEAKLAEGILRRIIDNSKPPGKKLNDAASVRLAESYAMQGRANSARRELLKILNQDTDSDCLEQAFALLRDISKEDEDDLLKMLLAWAAERAPVERHALALFHVGQWLMEHGRDEQATGFFEAFRILNPGHEREGEALRALMTLYGAQRADDRVLEIAKDWRTRFGAGGEDTVDFLTGMVRHSRSEYANAATFFEKSAAAAADIVQAQRAIYNAGISALLGGDETRFQLCLAQLQAPVAKPLEEEEDAPPQRKSDTETEDQAARLILERALHLAAQRDSKAVEALQEFLKLHAAHPRAVEAHLALAELCLLDLPARTRAAGTSLDAAVQLPNLSDAWRERLDYTRVWWHEAAANLEGVIADGTNFLKLWPDSRRRDEVRMKIAQASFRLEDFAKAEAEFEALAEEHGDSPYAEVALFFAGRAAMSLLTDEGVEKAISLWEEVITRGGPLMREAQRQQALAKRRQGKEGDALLVIENLLTGKPAPTGDERTGLLTEKGELLALLARTDPKHLDEAIGVFSDIARDKTATRSWRARAGVLLAQCSRQSGKTAEALEACFDVVESGLAAKPSQPLTPQEHTWLYRAGFMAIELLEAKRQWPAAALLADRLALAGGERAEEARQHATRLRLEHFLWEK